MKLVTYLFAVMQITLQKKVHKKSHKHKSGDVADKFYQVLTKGGDTV